MKRDLLQLQSVPNIEAPDGLFICLILVFFTLFAVNFIVTIRYRIYENRSSIFITSSLMLLDLARMLTFLAILFYTDKLLSSEILIRLDHDIPSFLFDCVTLALIFQFIQTYEILANPEQGFQNMQTSFYVRIEYAMLLVYAFLIVFDLISLGVDFAHRFETGHKTLSDISEFLLCLMVTAIWLIYVIMFARFLNLFKQSKGALDSIKCQVVIFFTTVISLLTFRLVMHWLYFSKDITDSIIEIYENPDNPQLFWFHFAQVINTLIEMLFNIVVVYNLVDNVRN